MSVLWKRWENLWTSLPHLWFELTLSDDRTHFMYFVERVLCLHDADIKRFTLSCEVPCDAPRVHSWVSAAVRKNVTDLYIEIPHLAGLPCTICFSSLKILTIKYFVFGDEGTTQKLFSDLPVLEKLYLEDCSWEFIKVLSISAPQLHFLSISELQTEILENCQIIIFGDCLKEFVYTGHLLMDYCLFNSLFLETADIDLVPCDITSEEMSYRVHNLLVGVCNVKYLTLSYEVVQFLVDAPELCLIFLSSTTYWIWNSLWEN
ncbi:hypothetical protein CJ030_MR2G004001 [Morella rubra]|uniref:FBD domain-containing protein n=1 Tax=Morella rubra TaxID=262757 RepID=A0A6A1W9A9_9ROSI|nr:hypothetical protein CJ030_MR2G004001 [Morella rubra]